MAPPSKAPGRGSRGGGAKRSKRGSPVVVFFRDRPVIARVIGITFLGACLVGALGWAFAGCGGWDPRSPFERNAPEVDEALAAMEAGKLESAEKTLERFLSTGSCGADAGIELSSDVRKLPNGSFDLGLVLFRLGERYGRRFGEEEEDAGPAAKLLEQKRATEVACALILVQAIGADPTVPAELRARARYLSGNLEFLRRRYQNAVSEYDDALSIVPGMPPDAGVDGIGRDAAWNRAIALRRIEDERDAGPDTSDASDASNAPDAADGSDGSDKPDAAPDAGPDASDGGEHGDGGGSQPDAGSSPDAGRQPDGGQPGDGGADPKPEDKKPTEPPQQDQKTLDLLEQAPSYQGQEAKQRARVRHRSTMVDK